MKPGSATFEACRLLTGEEVSKILGVKGMVPTPMPSGGWIASQCAWHGSTSGFFIAVATTDTIKAFGDPSALDAKAKLAQFKQQTGATVVRDVGDGAVLAASGLAAYEGPVYIQLTNLGLTNKAVTAIAKLAISHL